MTTPRNKGRAPGITVIGIPMPAALKERIQKAAELSDRKMADWARIQLRDAAESVIAKHQGSKTALLQEQSFGDLKVAEDPNIYQNRANGGN